jgi:valyl-tRNA synthetase
MCDDKLIKLKKRIESDLPNYSQYQIQRQREVFKEEISHVWNQRTENELSYDQNIKLSTQEKKSKRKTKNKKSYFKKNKNFQKIKKNKSNSKEKNDKELSKFVVKTENGNRTKIIKKMNIRTLENYAEKQSEIKFEVRRKLFGIL